MTITDIVDSLMNNPEVVTDEVVEMLESIVDFRGM